MARKLNKNLVALGSAAIVGVYAIGFVRTETPAAGSSAELAAIVTPTPSAVAQAVAQATQAAAQRSRTGAQGTVPGAASAPAATPSAPVVAAPASDYRDGTYTGSGTSRHGGFEVTLTIEGGRITAVDLTRVTTRYPASRIAQLPGQVLSRQSAAVDMVSGATDSSRAFRDAVTQALAKATTAVTAG